MVQQSRKNFNNLTLAAGVFFAITLLLPQGVFSQEGAPAPEQAQQTDNPQESVTSESTKGRGFWGKRSKKKKDNAAAEQTNTDSGQNLVTDNPPAAAEAVIPEVIPAVPETAATPEVISEAAAVIEDLTAVETLTTDTIPAVAETADVVEESAAAVEETANAVEETTAAVLEEAVPAAEILNEIPAETLVQDVQPAAESLVQEVMPVVEETTIAAEEIAVPVVEEAAATVAEIIPVQPAADDKNTRISKEIEAATKANEKEMQLIAKDFRLKMNAAKTEQERLAYREEMKAVQNQKATEFQQTLEQLKAVLE